MAYEIAMKLKDLGYLVNWAEVNLINARFLGD
jgi:hypothetical protein